MKNWLQVSKKLTKFSYENLIKLIKKLFHFSENNADLIEAECIDPPTTVDALKDEIKRYLAPDEPWKKRQKIDIAAAKRVIINYQKTTHDPVHLIDLMVYSVECGTWFSAEFQLDYDNYYAVLTSFFEKALKLIGEHQQAQMVPFVTRLHRVVLKANYNDYRTYHDTISKCFMTYYPYFRPEGN